MSEVGKHDLLLVSSLKLMIKHFAEAGTDWPDYLQYIHAMFYLKSWNKSEDVYFVEKNIKNVSFNPFYQQSKKPFCHLITFPSNLIFNSLKCSQP